MEPDNPQVDVLVEARELLAKATPGPWFDFEQSEWLHEPKSLLSHYDDAMVIARAPEVLSSLCNELQNARSETDRMRAALEAITNIAGNLSDEVVENVNGVNDARSRALMVLTARQIAKNALAPKGEQK